MSETKSAGFKLPATLTGRADLARLLREIETVDGDLEAQKVRSGGTVEYHMPTMSQTLNDFLEINQLDITNEQARMVLKEQLRVLKDKAPIIHLTFAVEADRESVQQLAVWLRENTHPQALLSIGLQPGLVGGVYVRTPNQVHDFSMRALFANSRDVLTKEIEELAA